MPYESTSRGAIVGPALCIVVAAVWAGHYVFTTASNSDQDEAAIALILPLLYVVVGLGLLIVIQNVLSAARGHTAANDGAARESHGLADKKRLTYLAATALYISGLPYFGFVASSLVFFVCSAVLFGTRTAAPLVLSACLIMAVLVGGFAGLLGVNLPLWPEGVSW
ncbi:MAG: tripartite tricarboxylate transporter TctB family protein [Pseudomonadota bacterium]